MREHLLARTLCLPTKGSRAARGPAKRTPRGANHAGALRVVEERPGVGATELAQATGIARPVLYNLLKTLEERGEVAKEQLPGGTTGYRLTASRGRPASRAPAQTAPAQS